MRARRRRQLNSPASPVSTSWQCMTHLARFSMGGLPLRAVPSPQGSRTCAAGLENMRRGVVLLREQNILLFDGLLKIALAEAEAAAGDLDRALALLDEGMSTADRLGHRTFEAELPRPRGDILLQRAPASPAPAEEAFQSAIAVASAQETRSFGLRAALALARLYESTRRPVEAHAVLAPALEGFAPTLEMPEIAEAEALLTALAATDEVKVEAAHRQRLMQLRVAYGNALFAARGFGALEVTETFARARESASGDADAPDRLAVDYGLFAGSYNRGELPSMRTLAATFLSDVEARPDSPEAGVAHRVMGMTCWFAGEYQEGRDRIERALALFQPGRDDDLAFRFGLDPGIAAMSYLAIVSWPLGDADRAYSLVDRQHARMACVTHIGSRCWGTMLSGLFDMMRGDHTRAAPMAFELARLAREHELTMYRAVGAFLRGWVTDAGHAPGDGLEDMRRAADELREQKVFIFGGLIKITLAEAEARAGDPGRSLAILDEALMTCERTGGRAFQAELYRGRGDILLQRDPSNLAPAEEAFLTAIAVAKQQGTRSFELRAALALAKLYQSTTRPVEAHSVLASALDGFSPTVEMPEIAEAQALLAALAETEEVKTIVTQHERRLRLQADYGRAVMYSRGFAAAETKSAFARAMELAARTDDFSARFSAFDGQCRSAIVRGELRSAWELASSFLREAEETERLPKTPAARRSLGLIAYFLGDFVAARAHLEQALHECGTEHGEETWERFGDDTSAVAMSYLALTTWQLGEVERARELIDTANLRTAKIGHGPSKAIPLYWMSYLEILRGDPKAALCTAEALVAVAQAHAMTHFSNMAELKR